VIRHGDLFAEFGDLNTASILKGDGALAGVKVNMSPLSNVESKVVAPGACYEHRCQNHHLLAQRYSYSVVMCLLTIRDVMPSALSTLSIHGCSPLDAGCAILA
jgi:hypothetical protein